MIDNVVVPKVVPGANVVVLPVPSVVVETGTVDDGAPIVVVVEPPPSSESSQLVFKNPTHAKQITTIRTIAYDMTLASSARPA
jgi:hypothetical protein